MSLMEVLQVKRWLVRRVNHARHINAQALLKVDLIFFLSITAIGTILVITLVALVFLYHHILVLISLRVLVSKLVEVKLQAEDLGSFPVAVLLGLVVAVAKNLGCALSQEVL